MANDKARLAEFAGNLWNNFIHPKFKESCRNMLKYYRAKVVSNPGNRTLNIKRPYDNAVVVPCTDYMESASAGAEVIVVQFGNNNANVNSLVVGYSNGSITQAVWTEPAVTSSRCLINHGGYYCVGKRVYLEMEIETQVEISQNSTLQILENLPVPICVNTPISTIADSNNKAMCLVGAGGILEVSVSESALPSASIININGTYLSV